MNECGTAYTGRDEDFNRFVNQYEPKYYVKLFA